MVYRVNLFFETMKSKKLEEKVSGFDMVRLRCSVLFEKRNQEISIHDAIINTGAHASLIPFSIWKDVEVIELAEHRVKGISVKPECSIPVVIGKIKLCIIDDVGNSTDKIEVHAYLSKIDEVPLILGFKDLLSKGGCIY